MARRIKDLVPPFPSEDWLSRRLNKGIIPGAKPGRTWVMTDGDIRVGLETFRNTPRRCARGDDLDTGLTEAALRKRQQERPKTHAASPDIVGSYQKAVRETPGAGFHVECRR
ncbi:hypothetical protein MHEL_39440 [Mycolicibacterium helvum]|uniref:Uncharacterized protein n=2 Tax=Mycolicibacterium helvum TaxID=1534349 RepID=A0A7I7TB43_9MYCO|nr:hypothetical protein MHEL_39440 [Mycolicibacterium helvum]